MRPFVTRIIAIATAFAATPPPHAVADEALSLYQAMEIVTGTDMRERPRGFALCLEDVLVKVSGDPRLRSDPRIAEPRRHAADYVVSFNYVDPIATTKPKDDQGTYDRSENLTVTFDPVKIDALLTALGDPPWHGPRPVLEPVLSVHGRKPPPWLLSADDTNAAEQRAAFERVAAEAGLPLKFPPSSELSSPGNDAPCGSEQTIIVVGTLDWSEAALGWVGTWRTCWRGAQHAWSVRGVGYDQAFANIVEGVVLLASGRGGPEIAARVNPLTAAGLRARPHWRVIPPTEANRKDPP
jgi:hypothetical protein